MCSCLFTCDEIQNVCQLGQAQCLGFTIIMSHWAKCTTLLSIEYMSKITLFRAKFSTKVTPLPRRKNKIPPWFPLNSTFIVDTSFGSKCYFKVSIALQIINGISPKSAGSNALHTSYNLILVQDSWYSTSSAPSCELLLLD